MDTFRFPECRVVRVGSLLTQVTTAISEDENGYSEVPKLSESSQELIQKIIKATLLSPPAHTVTQLDHEEFCLSITKRPWTLRQKYDFFIDDAQVDTMPFKFWFQLSGPQVDPQEVEEEEDV
ncbi:hypothetical protein BGX31_009860 [Mortierella sp. GBA43]|nr:hypothetical protein BGX31_009860 [Mortierella sp. GBA43]